MINITNEEMDSLKAIQDRYQKLHFLIDQFQFQLDNLRKTQRLTVKELNENREHENKLINKLEEKYNTKIDPAMLMEILGIETNKI